MSDVFKTLCGRRVLVVDDSVHITLLLNEVFARCGATVVVANSGLEALSHLKTEEFDLLVLDLWMPEPNGLDIMRFMRQSKPEMLNRTILLTGDRYHHDLLESIEQTEIQVAYKPFDIKRLRAAACEVIERSTSRDGVNIS
jgi:DNA-binding NtrC family response regulator